MQRSMKEFLLKRVSIPHGGLRTTVLVVKKGTRLLNVSPSHTVGSEPQGGSAMKVQAIPHGGLGNLAWKSRRYALDLASPSHTVGSELSHSRL
jgi:hypothetical protein